MRFAPTSTFAASRLSTTSSSYSRYSANPVGRLVLYLFGYRDLGRQRLSDQVCSGLQLANFWQDVAVDLEKGRVYLPRQDMTRFGVSVEDLRLRNANSNFAALMRHEVARARELLMSGAAARRDGGQAALARHHDVRRRRTGDPAGYRAGGLRRLSPPPGRSANWTTCAWAGEHCGGALKPESIAVASMPAADAALREDYARCASITRRSSSNFYYAFMLLPAERRQALYSVYAFCRFVDDIADDAVGDEAGGKPAKLLARWREELERVFNGSPTHAISRALAYNVRRFAIPRRYFEEIIDGVEMDLGRTRYATFEELRLYCYRVASAVGLVCIEIFGYRNPRTREYAENLGIAFQLTNIIRDLSEDAARGRIYLPLEDLARFDVSEDEILRGADTLELRRLLEHEVERARSFYAQAEQRAGSRRPRRDGVCGGDAFDLPCAARADREQRLRRGRPAPSHLHPAQALPGRPHLGRYAAAGARPGARWLSRATSS